MAVDAGEKVARRCLPNPTELSVFHCRLYENKGEADFMESLLQLFRSISDMMSSVSDQTVRVKVGPRLQQHQPRSRPSVRGWALCARWVKRGLTTREAWTWAEGQELLLWWTYSCSLCNEMDFGFSVGALKCCHRYVFAPCEERFWICFA